MKGRAKIGIIQVECAAVWQMKIPVAVILTLSLAGCTRHQQSAERVSAIPFTTPPKAAATAVSTPIPMKRAVKRAAAPPISEITFERQAAPPGTQMNPPPVYALTLRSDGTASYIGVAYTNNKGTYYASVAPAEFVRLAQLVEAKHFFDLAPLHGPVAMTHVSNVSISVVRKGKRKTVVYCEEFGPADNGWRDTAPQQSLKEIAHQLEQLRDSDALIENWQKMSEGRQTPGYTPEWLE